GRLRRRTAAVGVGGPAARAVARREHVRRRDQPLRLRAPTRHLGRLLNATSVRPAPSFPGRTPLHRSRDPREVADVRVDQTAEPRSDHEGNPMIEMNPNLLLNAANVMLLIAYSVRDVLWLRLLAAASSVIAAPYFVMQPQPLWPRLAWSAVFAAINTYQAWILFLERRPVVLGNEEQRLYDLTFHGLRPREFLELASIGTWMDVSPSRKLVEAGRPVEEICAILSGAVRLECDGKMIGTLGPGDLVGSALLIAGLPSQGDALVVEPSRCLGWKVDALRRYTGSKPAAREQLAGIANKVLTGKLMRLTGA